MRPPRLLPLLGALVALLALASCSGSASPGTHHTSSTVSGASTKTAAPTSASPAPATVAASPTTASAPTVAACRTRDLDVTVHPLGGAAGTAYYDVVMTNRGSQACRTGGYGGVSLVGGGNGTQIGKPADRDTTVKPTPITLAAGGRVHARLSIAQALNYSKSTCDPVQADGLRIYPPNETRSAFVKLSVTGCRSERVSLLRLAPYRLVH